MHHGRTSAQHPQTMMAFFLLLLVPVPSPADSPLSREGDSILRKEWEEVRADQERAIRDNQKRLAEISVRAGEPDVDTRTEKIIRERVGMANAFLRGDVKGQILAQTAESAGRDREGLAGLYTAQSEYLDRAIGNWGRGTERENLQKAISLLQRNMERTKSHLARATEAAEAISTSPGRSAVLDKVGQIETAVKEAGERLSARWESERAMRERERQQREREAGERAREHRQ
jgi:hypothetical protein